MTTTVNLAPDVAQLLTVAMRDSGQSLDDVLNQAVRRCLVSDKSDVDEEPFVVEPFAMGTLSNGDERLPSQLEHDSIVEDFLEVTTKRRERLRGSS